MSSASPSPLNDRIGDTFFSRNMHSKDDEELSHKRKRDESIFDRKTLAKIKIIVPNVDYTKDNVDLKRRKRLEKGIITLEQVLQLTQDGKIGVVSRACYNSQEFETPANKELRKIQVSVVKKTFNYLGDMLYFLFHLSLFINLTNDRNLTFQIEIRRTIPRDRISTSPVRRSLRDPSTVVFTRKSGRTNFSIQTF